MLNSLDSKEWLDIVNAGLVVLIWLVQLIIYPSFAHINETAFVDWHKKYVARITSCVAPLMIAQVLLVLRLLATTPIFKYYLMLSCILIIWYASFSLSVPCHRKLQKSGKNVAVINRLILTNWVRTILWTVVFLTGILVSY